MYNLEQSTVKRDMCVDLKPGWFKPFTNWEFRKPVGFCAFNSGLPRRRAKTKRWFFSRVQSEALKGAWELHSKILIFRASGSWKKTQWLKQSWEPLFFWSFLEGLYKPTKKFPLILLSVPMRRACRFFLFFCFEAATKYKLKPDWYVQSCLKFEMFGAWFLSGLVHQPSILSLLWQAAQPKPPRGSYH